MDESLLFELSPEELVLFAFVLTLSLAQQSLTIEEEYVIGSFLSFMGHTFTAIANQRLLIRAQQSPDTQEQIKQLQEQIRQLQWQINQLR